VVVVCYTVLFEGVRSVMTVGGSCGSSGTGLPPCPGTVGGLLPAAIWGGLIFAALYVWQCTKHHVPSFTALLWPALFLSLAYNFFDFAFNGSGGTGGWILMGAVPLV
jgi:hypothetical protein